MAAAVVAAGAAGRALIAPLAAMVSAAGTAARTSGVGLDASLLADGPVRRAPGSARGPGVTDATATSSPVTGVLAAGLVAPLPIRAAAAAVPTRVSTGRFAVLGPARAVTALLRRLFPTASTGGLSPVAALIRRAALTARVAGRSGPLLGLPASLALGLSVIPPLVTAPVLLALPLVALSAVLLSNGDTLVLTSALTVALTSGTAALVACLTAALVTCVTTLLVTSVTASSPGTLLVTAPSTAVARVLSLAVTAASLTAGIALAAGVPLLVLAPLFALHVDRNLRTLLSLWRIRVSRHVRNEPACVLERRAGHGRAIDRARRLDAGSPPVEPEADRAALTA